MAIQGTVEVDGTALAYEIEGSGDPVVFVHGVLLDRRNWHAQRDAVAASYSFVSLDLRGHGETPLGTGPYDVERHAEDLATLLRSVDLGPAHLVGHSLGAKVVASVMLADPGLVRSAVLVEPSLDGALPADDASRQAVADLVACMQRVADAVHAGDDIAAMRVLAEWTDNGQLADWSLVPADYVDILRHNARTVALLLGGRSRRIPLEQLRSISHPTLVVNGARSRPYFIRIGEHLSAALPNARHLLLPGASHDVARHVPRQFNEALLDFLKSH